MSRTTLCLPASIAMLASTVCLTSAADLSVEVSWTRLPGTTGLDPAHWGVPSVNYGTGGGDATLHGSDPSISILRGSDDEPSVPPGHTRFTIYLPNWIDEEPLKTFSGFISMVSMNPEPTVPSVYGENNGAIVVGSITLTPDEENVRYLISGSIRPNPDFEYIEILVGDNPSVGMPINGFHIRTESIPSPGSFGLLGLAGACALLPRRRR